MSVICKAFLCFWTSFYTAGLYLQLISFPPGVKKVSNHFLYVTEGLA